MNELTLSAPEASELLDDFIHGFLMPHLGALPRASLREARLSRFCSYGKLYEPEAFTPNILYKSHDEIPATHSLTETIFLASVHGLNKDFVTRDLLIDLNHPSPIFMERRFSPDVPHTKLIQTIFVPLGRTRETITPFLVPYPELQDRLPKAICSLVRFMSARTQPSTELDDNWEGFVTQSRFASTLGATPVSA